MENTDFLDRDMPGRFEINDQMIGYIRESAKWGKFLSIIGFVIIGFLVVIALFLGFATGSIFASMRELNGFGAFGGMFIMVIYLAIGALYLYPTLKLYKFSTMAKTAIDQRDNVTMMYAFENLKSMFKFMGILMAIVLGFYALMFVFGILMGGLSLLG